MKRTDTNGIKESTEIGGYSQQNARNRRSEPQAATGSIPGASNFFNNNNRLLAIDAVASGKYLTVRHRGYVRQVPIELVTAKIRQGAPDECWPWLGQLKRGGRVAGQEYGLYSVKMNRYGYTIRLQAHRAAYIIEHGQAPLDQLVRHMCHNPRCCNPAHLRLGSHAENMGDMRAAGRSLAGDRNPRAKLTPIQVLAIKALRKQGCTLKQIGGWFGVHLTTVDYACRGKTWAA